MDFLSKLSSLVWLVAPPTSVPRVAGRNVSSERLRLVVVHGCRAKPRGVDDRCRLSLTSAAGSGRRRWTVSLVVDVCDRKRKASTDGGTCRWRLRLKTGGVDGRYYLTTTVEDRRRRRTVLLVTDDYSREQKASTDRATYRWWLPVSTKLIADDYW